MSKLLQIIKKNFRLLVRSKSSALIVLFGPLLLILLISMAFNTSSLYDIKIGTYSDTYSDLSNSIIEQLNQDEFKAEKIDTSESCVNSVKSGDIHVCAVFPANLDVNTNENIAFHVDKSRINLVYIIINSISTEISTKSTELSTSLTSSLLNSITFATGKVNEASGTITQLSVGLKDIKDSVSSIQNTLKNLNDTTNITILQGRADELNLTGDAGELIEDYQSAVSSLRSKVDNIGDSSSGLGAISSKLGTRISNTNDINSVFSQITNNFNAIQIKDVSKIVSPISTEIKPISLEDTTHFNYTFPILLVIILLFSGLLVSSTTILEEKSSKAFFRNFITPTSSTLFIFGNYISNLLIVFSQIAVIFLALYLFSEIVIVETIIINLILVILLTGSVFILLGMLLGYLFKSEETANLAVISLACILLFFSNTILPIETLPTAIKSIADYNPFILGADALKEILLFNAPLSSIETSFYILFGYIIGLFILIHIARTFSKRRYVEY